MGRLVEVVVDSIRVQALENRHVVLLKDSERGRYLLIWIGVWEANAIALSLQGLQAERPLTHDLFVAALAALGVRVERAIVSDLAGQTYHARLVLAPATGGAVEVDARPSDAIAIALRAACPILVDEAVLDAASIPGDPDPRAEPRPTPGHGAPPLEALEGGVADEGLDVFRAFVNSLENEGGEGGRRTQSGPEA